MIKNKSVTKILAAFFAASLSLSAPNGAMGIPVFAEESGDGSDVTATGATDPSDVPDDTVEEIETNQPDAPAESEGTSTGDDPAAGSQPEENNGSGGMPATDNGSTADSRLDENKGSEGTPSVASNGEETPAETKSAKETVTDTNDVEEADLNSNLLTLNVERAPAASDSNTSDAVVLGDIAVRKSGETDTAFDTENSAVYEVKAGEAIDLALTLNTTQIKQQMKDYYDLAISQLSTAGTAVLHETSSQFVATVTFPETMDLSGLDLDAIKDDNLTYYDPNDGSYKHTYTDTSRAVIDSNYQLDKCGKFNISDVSLDQSTRTMTITMDLDVSKLNYTGDNPAGTYAYGHLVCLYEAVESTPDYLSAIIPGIKVNEDYDGSETTINGTVRGEFRTIVGGGNWWQFLGKLLNFEWGGVQDTSINGGTDAAGSEDTITLTVKSSTPAPTPTPVPDPTPATWDHSKSKTATNLDSKYESEITLSLPSAEEQLVSDIVFVLDKSSCKEETASKAVALLDDLKNSLGASGAKAKIAVVAFDGTSHVLQGLTDFTGTDAEISTIHKYMAANSIPPAERVSGTNMHAGLLAADQMLSADSEVIASRKYVVMVSDGLTRLFTGSDGKVKDIYWQTTYQDLTGKYADFDPKAAVYFGMIDEWSSARSNGKYGIPYGDWNTYLAYVNQWVAADGDTYVEDFLTYSNDATSKVKNPATGEITDSSFKYVPYHEYDKHALSVDRAVYEAYNEYTKLTNAGIHCYAVNVGNSDFGNAFMAALNQISGSTKADFSMIRNEILYLLDAGSTVDDYLGFVNGDYNFDLISPETMTLTVDNTNSGTSETYTAEVIGNNHYGFVKQNDGTYKYEVTYYPEDKNANEHFTWKMNVPVTNFEHVSLKYKVKLMNPKEAPGTYGEYDRDGSQGKNSLYTNSKAILHFTDSEKKDRRTEEFAKPTVSYTVNKAVTPGPQKTSVSFKKTIPSAKYVPSKFVPRTATAHAEKKQYGLLIRISAS
jgi:hypothetical protein